MSCRLIINADDFGLTSGINRAIEQLHRAGVLTSTTLMATGPAFDEAVAIARANPSLGVGCHVVLTDGVPVSLPETIPTLLGPDGRTFRPSLIDFVQALLRGKVREEEIEREALAQIQKLQRAGIDVTHVDTHKHTHLFPAVARPLLRVLEHTSIPAIRNPFEPEFTQRLAHAGFKRRLQLSLLNRLSPAFERHNQLRHAHILTTDGTLGVSATGNVNPATLSQLLANLPGSGIFELVCHPGYNDADLDRINTRLRTHREIEMQALMSAIPSRLAQPNPPGLINYGNLGALPQIEKHL
ncbi:ChbG/HpnK family deacetylase [Edaphobacter bradus]|uniref:ChbG/HpnK family deacetylase n=1 Tax=Edaphobacter bradus TaxID=2259016 RepID=UPI0021E08648|nr:ChbG/HpnK family deacetylase [Edaphobacter bradus]